MLKNLNKLEKEKSSKGEKICTIEQIENYFDVDKQNVSVISCGNDTGDGPYPGSGYYCYIEVEKND